MTVKELIHELSLCDENKTVEIRCSYDCGFGEAGGEVSDIIETDSDVELYSDESW